MKVIYILLIVILPLLLLGGSGLKAAEIDLSFTAAGAEKPSLLKYINTIYDTAIVIGGVAALFMIILGGIFYIISAGSDKKSEGKEIILGAIWGLALLLGAYLILKTINPRLVNLEEPGTYLGLPKPSLRPRRVCGGPPITRTNEKGEPIIIPDKECTSDANIETGCNCLRPCDQFEIMCGPLQEQGEDGCVLCTYKIGESPCGSDFVKNCESQVVYEDGEELIVCKPAPFQFLGKYGHSECISETVRYALQKPYYRLGEKGIEDKKCIAYAYKKELDQEKWEHSDLKGWKRC